MHNSTCAFKTSEKYNNSKCHKYILSLKIFLITIFSLDLFMIWVHLGDLSVKETNVTTNLQFSSVSTVITAF